MLDPKMACVLKMSVVAVRVTLQSGVKAKVTVLNVNVHKIKAEKSIVAISLLFILCSFLYDIQLICVVLKLLPEETRVIVYTIQQFFLICKSNFVSIVSRAYGNLQK